MENTMFAHLCSLLDIAAAAAAAGSAPVGLGVFNNLTAASGGFVSPFCEIKFGIPSTSIPTN
jgi:hypothetical protein